MVRDWAALSRDSHQGQCGERTGEAANQASRICSRPLMQRQNVKIVALMPMARHVL